MSQPRRGLGRGLGALIPTAPPDVSRETNKESGTESAPSSSAPSSTAPSGTESSGTESSGTESAPSGSDVITSTDTKSRDEWRDRGRNAVADSALDTSVAAEPSRPVSDGSLGAEHGARSAPGDLATIDGAYFAEIPVDMVTPNPRQPREAFDEEAMAELVHSITEIGLLQPVVVRPIDGGAFELVMGERRWRATKEAGLDVIPAIVRETADENLLRDALLENLHRSQLNPLEEAAAYQQLLDDFGCTHDELASRIGRSRPQISNTLRLLRLTPAVQRRVAAGVLSAGHARALVSVGDAARQEHLAQRVVAEGLSVRALEEVVALGEGDDPSIVARQRPRRPVAPKLADLADRLADRFDTRVKVDLGKTKGKITVEFASLDDLERIIGLMDPAAATSQD